VRFSSRCSDGSFIKTLFHCQWQQLDRRQPCSEQQHPFWQHGVHLRSPWSPNLSPQEWDSHATFIGMVHSGLPSLHTALKESSDKDGAASGAGGSSESPNHRGCNVVTSTNPITATPAAENTLALQTIPMIMVRTVAPQPGMELLPIQ
jgi:hypothetical protein